MRFNWFSYCDFKIENLKALRFSVHVFRSPTHFQCRLVLHGHKWPQKGATFFTEDDTRTRTTCRSENSNDLTKRWTAWKGGTHCLMIQDLPKCNTFLFRWIFVLVSKQRKLNVAKKFSRCIICKRALLNNENLAYVRTTTFPHWNSGGVYNKFIDSRSSKI